MHCDVLAWCGFGPSAEFRVDHFRLLLII